MFKIRNIFIFRIFLIFYRNSCNCLIINKITYNIHFIIKKYYSIDNLKTNYFVIILFLLYKFKFVIIN